MKIRVIMARMQESDIAIAGSVYSGLWLLSACQTGKEVIIFSEPGRFNGNRNLMRWSFFPLSFTVHAHILK